MARPATIARTIPVKNTSTKIGTLSENWRESEVFQKNERATEEHSAAFGRNQKRKGILPRMTRISADVRFDPSRALSAWNFLPTKLSAYSRSSGRSSFRLCTRPGSAVQVDDFEEGRNTGSQEMSE
jgi:hypothetical protein